jgi:predicted nucleic acid-binding Zn ribbon protein
VNVSAYVCGRGEVGWDELTTRQECRSYLILYPPTPTTTTTTSPPCSQSNFLAHQLIHSEHQFQCEACGRGYKTLRSLQKHALTHVTTESADVEKLYCRWCSKRFFVVTESDKTAFTEHEMTHSRTKQHDSAFES